MLDAGERNAPLIVLVHGLNASADVWRPFIPSLASHLHVVCFDLPGFGHSSKGNKLYSPDNYAALIHYIVGKFQAHRIILVGHSLGGNIALRYAETYPSQVDRLVLIDAAGILHRLVYTEFFAHYGIRALPDIFPEQRQNLRSLANRLFGVLTDYSSLFGIGERYMIHNAGLRQKILHGYPPAIAAYAMALTNFSGVLNHFDVPTLLLWGGEDHVAPLRTAHMLAANFDNAGLIVFPHTGHNPLTADTEQVNDWLVRFATADPDQRDRILHQHLYAPPPDVPLKGGRVAECHGQQHQTFEGAYRRIILNHCEGVLLKNFSARRLIAIDSQASLLNCRIRSTGRGLVLKNSSITMTACWVKGAPAISLQTTKLDIAGSHIRSRTHAILARDSGAVNTILFSISQLHSGDQTQLMHGPVLLEPGQAL